MRVRKTDANGDMVFGGNQAAFWRNAPEGVAQVVNSRLQLWVGQWYLDLDSGTPYQTRVLGKYTDKSRDPVLRARILGSPGVTEIAAYSSFFDSNTRSFSLSATLKTAYSVTTDLGRTSTTANLDTTVYQDR